MWFVATAALVVMTIGAGLLALFGELIGRIVAMQLAATLGVLALLTFAEASGRDVYFDLAVVMAAMSFAGTVVFLRMLGTWL
jgi:multicomponent Na+:H+ antiporter subunit F